MSGLKCFSIIVVLYITLESYGSCIFVLKISIVFMKHKTQHNMDRSCVVLRTYKESSISESKFMDEHCSRTMDPSSPAAKQVVAANQKKGINYPPPIQISVAQMLTDYRCIGR